MEYGLNSTLFDLLQGLEDIIQRRREAEELAKEGRKGGRGVRDDGEEEDDSVCCCRCC